MAAEPLSRLPSLADELERRGMPRDQAVLLDRTIRAVAASTMEMIGKTVDALVKSIDSNGAALMKSHAPFLAIVRVLREKGTLTPDDVEHFQRAVGEVGAEIDAGRAVDLAIGDDSMRKVKLLTADLQEMIRRFTEDTQP